MNSTASSIPSPTTYDPAFAREERRFRRLEVSLPVWISTEDAVNQGFDVWELGYTRDLSLGGAKIIVPAGEETMWRRSLEIGTSFVVRFAGAESDALIPARLRRVATESSNGQIALGIAFNYDQARSACERAVASGLATKRTRRRWQGAFVVALGVLVAAGAYGGQSIHNLRTQIAARNAQIARLQKAVLQTETQLQTLAKPIIVQTKSAGIDRAFQSAELQTQLSELRSNIARLNDPRNMNAAIEARNIEAKKLGLTLSPASKGARVQLAVAFPYGYNWPLVVNDLESALGRRVPQVVVFSDWKQPFPDLDARQARALGKTLQITWEPWNFGNPSAVQLRDIAAGKYDAYIDSWANAARAFGGEIWLRFGHEMNGNWYPWTLSAQNGDPAPYLNSYRRIHDRFRKAGASNVRWIWCFNAESVPQASWNDPKRAYPGDDYVDAIGIDGYNFGDTTAHSRWQSFSQIFAAPYALASQQWPRKPLFIAETGCSSTGGDKVAWLKDMDESLRTKFTRVESLTWFEAAKEADWRVLSTLGTAKTARTLWKAPFYGRGVN
ncbi:endoglucanase H [Abditibacteriota bacterium]|nr:endoglucanase H [Abditibacteriota bacterium]